MISQHWRLEYEATLDDLRNVSLRGVRRSEAIRKWRQRSIFGAGIGGFIGAAFVGTMVVGIPISLTLLLASVAGIVTAMSYPRIYDWHVGRRVVRLIVEKFGDRPAVPCTIELRDEGARVRQGNTELMLSWRDGESVNVTDLGVELQFKPVGLVLAPRRAFTSQEHFLEFFERGRALASGTSTS